MSLQFVVSAYGDRYSGMLLTTVASILSSQQEACRVRVYWQDISESVIGPFMRAYAGCCEFIRTEFALAEDPDSRISMKTLLWEQAVAEADDGPLMLLDGDTLVTGDLSAIFAEGFDVGLTVKDERFPINSGVVLVRTPKKSLPFFRRWRELTISILQDRKRFDEAIAQYCGVDQMAFASIIGFQRGAASYAVEVDGVPLHVKAFPCSLLNETRSVPLVPDTLVYHFKGGWRPILTEGSLFKKHRPKSSSFEMYLLYMKTFLAAAGRIAERERGFDFARMGIFIPPYIKADGSASFAGYERYAAVFRVKKFLLKVRRRLAGK